MITSFGPLCALLCIVLAKANVPHLACRISPQDISSGISMRHLQSDVRSQSTILLSAGHALLLFNMSFNCIENVFYDFDCLQVPLETTLTIASIAVPYFTSVRTNHHILAPSFVVCSTVGYGRIQ
jgi:hypothetical protein